jgi:hypothetical protein
MYNLIHHKEDFDIEACWTYSASGHGKGPCDGIGATVKSTASRSVLTSGKAFLSVEDFYNFTKKFNDDMARVNSTAEVPINVFYLESAVIERVLTDLLTKRWNMLTGVFLFFSRFQRKLFFLRTHQRHPQFSSIQSEE